MSRYYQPPKETGREYVTTVEKFNSTTLFRCEKLPREWKESYLDPLIEEVNKAERLVEDANDIYINEKLQTKEEVITGVKDRLDICIKALRSLKRCDRLMDKILNRIDIHYTIKFRLKKEVLRVLEEAGLINKEDSADRDPDAKGNTKIKTGKLEISFGIMDCEYMTMNGQKFKTIRLTHQNVKNWLEIKHNADEALKLKIKKDKTYIKSLENQISSLSA